MSRPDQRRTGRNRPSQPPPKRSQTEDRPASQPKRRASKEIIASLRRTAIEHAEALQTGADWLRLLRYAEHFHAYGGTNALLILRDRPYATRLATYDQWKADGHPVRRGEHGITLLDPANPERTLRAFDITQTDQPPTAGPLRHLRPARHTANALKTALTSVCMRKGFDVLDNERDSAGRTAFADRTIHLHPGLTAEAACYALAHELAHVLLHTADQLDPASGACDGARLIEAESVAYILCRDAGLDVTPFTFPDPPAWAGDDPRADPGATILAAVDRITTTADRLIAQVDAIDPVPPRSAQPTAREAQPEATPKRPVRNTARPVRPPEPQRDPRLIAIHQRAERYFISQLPDSWVPGYLVSRGLAAAIGDNAPWGIGYAPATWTALTDHLRAHGYTDAEIIASGLGKRSRTGNLIDRFRDRAMIPVRDADGTTIAFIGRANPNRKRAGGHPIPKYLNSPRTPLYTKGTNLFGLDIAQPRLDGGAIPVLVEGTLDAIAIHIADPDHQYAPIAPSGTALTREQVTALAQAVDLGDRGVLIAFDGDTAGQRAATRAHQLLHSHTRRLLHARLGAGDDPAGLLQNHGPQRLLTALSEQAPLAAAVLNEHLTTTIDQPEWQRRDQAARLITEFIPAEVIRRLTTASLPTSDGAPENAAPLPAATAAALLPPVAKDLILRAAEAIGIPIRDQIAAVIEAADESAAQHPTAPAESVKSAAPAELAARDSPAPVHASTIGTEETAAESFTTDPTQTARVRTP